MSVTRTYSTIDEEPLESSNTSLHKRFQFVNISRDDAAIKADVDPALAPSGLDLLFEAGDGGGWRDGVEGHVNDRSNAAKCGGLGAGEESLPFSAARLVEVYMGIDEARKENGGRVVEEGGSKGKVGGL